jgi:hypothetical protein
MKNAAGRKKDRVAQFTFELKHPRKPELELLRQVILSADASITEGIKWNAPRFRCLGYFATFHLRAKQGAQAVLRTGATVKPELRDKGLAINDPQGILKWLAKDRCLAQFNDMADIESKRAAFVDIVRQWTGRMRAAG